MVVSECNLRDAYDAIFSYKIMNLGAVVWLALYSVLCVSLVSPQKKVDTPKDSLENERAPSFPLPPMKKDMTFQGVKAL